MVIPNSIPLLGKTLKRDYATFNAVVNKAKANVNVLLDDDALNDAKKIYKLLSSTNLKNSIIGRRLSMRQLDTTSFSEKTL